MAVTKEGDESQPHPVKDQLPAIDFCITSSPTPAEAIILGFQHYLVMLGTIVLIVNLVVPLMGGGNVEKAEVLQTMLFVAGLNTLLQSFFGTRLPVVMGPSFAFVLPSLSIVLSGRYSVYVDPHDRFKHTMRGIQGALLIASILQIVIGFLGFWRIIIRFLSPLSAVPFVTLTGLGLYRYGFPLLAQCIEIGLPELIVLVFLAVYVTHLVQWKGSTFISRYAVIMAVAMIWVFAILLTVAGAYNKRPPKTQISCRTDRSGLISGARWIRIPYPFKWGSPTFRAGDIFAMAAASLVALIESTGVFIAAARYGSATPAPPSVLSRGVGWQGIGILLGGMFGTVSGTTASVENAGLLGLTRVGSRRVVQIAAIFMLFFSVLGKFGAVLASIPLPIVGALFCVLFAYVASAGLSLLQFCNLNSFRAIFILGFSLFMGLSVPQYFDQYLLVSGHGPVHTRSMSFNVIVQVIFSSPATVAFVVAMFLDTTLGWGLSSSRTDSGRHWLDKFKYFDGDTRTAEFYSLPYTLNRYFPSV